MLCIVYVRNVWCARIRTNVSISPGIAAGKFRIMMASAEETLRSVATTTGSDEPFVDPSLPKDVPKPPKGCSVFRCSMNLLVVGAGLRMVWVAGVLARCGWILGFLLLAMCCCIGFSMCLYLHKIYMELQTSKSLANASLLPTYVSVVEHCLGGTCALFVWFCMNVTMVGFQASSIVLALQRLHEIFPSLSHASCCLVVAAASAPFSLIRSSVSLSYISMAGLAGSVVLAVSIFGAGLSQMLKHEDVHTSLGLFNVEEGLIALGHAMMSFNMSLVALPQIGGMREPRKFPKALAHTYGGLSCLYVVLAVLTYGGFGARLVLFGTPVDLIIQEGAKTFRSVIIAAIIVIAFAQYSGGFYTQGVSIDTISSSRTKQVLARLAVHALHTAIAFPCRTNMRVIVDVLSASTVPILAVIIPSILVLKRGLLPRKILGRLAIYLAVILSFVLVFCGTFNAIKRATSH